MNETSAETKTVTARPGWDFVGLFGALFTMLLLAFGMLAFLPAPERAARPGATRPEDLHPAFWIALALTLVLLTRGDRHRIGGILRPMRWRATGENFATSPKSVARIA